jgi:hypothetical protein
MKKIMFNDKYGLTQAVLDGRKTMTRRIIKYPKSEPSFSDFIGDYDEAKEKGYLDYGNGIVFFLIEDRNKSFLCAPSYKVGEVVAIAQSYETIYHEKGLETLDMLVSSWKNSKGWRNKMFVKADLMISHIRITNIKIERLQDISDEDCIREGVELNDRQYEYDGTKWYCVRGLGHWRAIGCDNFNTPREAFAALMDKVSGKGTWESNPYVFAYEFELID